MLMPAFLNDFVPGPYNTHVVKDAHLLCRTPIIDVHTT